MDEHVSGLEVPPHHNFILRRIPARDNEKLL